MSLPKSLLALATVFSSACLLAGNAGAPLARLAAAGSSHFAGQLEGGSSPVSFYR